MNTQLLKYVVEVERTGSISQAADNLYMGQPNLSKAIKELETAIGISIFKRTSKGVVPTQKGAEFLTYAKNILLQIDEMEARFNPHAAGKTSFKLSVPRTPYYSFALTDFLNKYSGEKELNVLFRETNAKRTISGVAYAAYSMGVVRYQKIYEAYFVNLMQEASLKHVPLFDFNAVVLVSKAQGKKLPEVLSGKDILSLTEIACADTLVPYAKNAIAEEPGKSDMRRRLLVNERASQIDMVKYVPNTFMWSSPLPEKLISDLGLVQKKCNVSDNNYRDVFVYRSNYKFSQADKMFINHFQDMLEELKASSSDVSEIVPGKRMM